MSAPSSRMTPDLRRPDAEDEPDQRGLARRARPDDAQALARLELEADALDQGRPRRRGCEDDALDLEPAARVGQRRDRRPRTARRRAVDQPPPRPARVDQRLPAADQLLGRLQRAAEQDRRRDHDPRRGGGADDEPRTEGEHRDLERLARDARDRSQPRRRRAETGLRVEQLVDAAPASDRLRPAVMPMPMITSALRASASA